MKSHCGLQVLTSDHLSVTSGWQVLTSDHLLSVTSGWQVLTSDHLLSLTSVDTGFKPAQGNTWNALMGCEIIQNFGFDVWNLYKLVNFDLIRSSNQRLQTQ